MGVDWTTVIFEMVNFGLLVLIMLRFVFRPVRRILDERKADLAQREAETAAREAEAAEVRARFETQLAEIDALAERRQSAALSEARAEGEAIIEEARAAARSDRAKAEAELGRARQRTLARFRAEVLGLGAQIARRVVGEIGTAELSFAFARRAVHALEDAVDGEAAAGQIRVEHSLDVEPDELEAFIRDELGAEVELRFEPDPELVSGVRLHADGREVESSVGASLDAWYRDLIGDEGDGEGPAIQAQTGAR
ncbi:ATP synthase subunit b, sodium ion specific [Enhygromyxa salina]|uniref:ATP synthase subunit b n=1 Tax=Enhygromyxa salina TaxID=215803 RepID=A0A2S9XIA8_9BACT|nr:hypothetical protein [Enhygromyxa salina]PRP92592.1 ATP synthase subunit b, sodium ion specific [Enhygromyxa salina]